MTRRTGKLVSSPHGRTLLGGEPHVFHCNYYNYFLQKTLLLDETLGMQSVIQDAAYASVRAGLQGAAHELGLSRPEERRELAEGVFSELGFGMVGLVDVGEGAWEARLPVSHYGRCLRLASGAEFAAAQSHFDAGYVAAAADFVGGARGGTSSAEIVACQSLGAPEGRVRVVPRSGAQPLSSPGQGAHSGHALPPPNSATNVDEGAILAALADLDFAGNEEGLIPRFNVMLTNHYANFYNRISFEFTRRMEGTGLLEAAEGLLVEAGFRCAFHTFGGIMTSPEWDAVVRPQCETTEDWVHGMVACTNTLGWGIYRVHELVAGERLVVRVYDDYESSGHLAMYGRAKRPVSHLVAGVMAGLMNLVYVGDIEKRKRVDNLDYEAIFESTSRFSVRHTRSFACGDPFTEVVVER